MSHKQKSAVELNQFNRFLGLPPEVRNRIYEYALTSSESVRPRKLAIEYNRGEWCGFYAEPRKRSNKTKGDEALSNKLRFVSRKLYHETAGLEFKFNDLCFDAFHGATNKRGAQNGIQHFRGQAADFLSFMTHVAYLRQNVSRMRVVRLEHFAGLAPALPFSYWYSDARYHTFRWRNNPTNIHLLTCMPDTPEMLLGLARICKENPMLRIDYTLARFTLFDWFERSLVPEFSRDDVFDPDAAIFQGLFYVAALRNKDLGDMSSLVDLSGHGALDKINQLQQAARQFREKFPHLGANEDPEKWFKLLAQPNLRFMPYLDPRLEGGMKKVLRSLLDTGTATKANKKVMEWAENGI